VRALGVTAPTFGARVGVASGPGTASTLITVRRSTLPTNPVEGTVRLIAVAPSAISVADFTLAP
jgi:hypothetical protein